MLFSKNNGPNPTLDAPFQGDALERVKPAEVLTKVVSSMSPSFVLAVDAGWGMGKTTFLKMWKFHLQIHGFRTLYYNAWENDFVPDPLISLLGELESALLPKGAKGKAKITLNKAIKFGSVVARQSLPIAARVATRGAVDLDALTEKAFGEAVERVTGEIIKGYEKDKTALKSFRECLKKFIAESGEDAAPGKPVIFFVDELDRCRPTYAVELLERVKHLFSVPGIVFVLATDMSQLEHSVRTLYGRDMDAPGYLRRFVDLVYRLPSGSPEQFANYLAERFGLWEAFSGRSGANIDFEIVKKNSSLFSGVFELSLRDQERCFLGISLFLHTKSKREWVFPKELAFLVCLKAKDPGLYLRLARKETTSNEIENRISLTAAGKDFLRGEDWGALEAFLRVGLASKSEIRLMRRNLVPITPQTPFAERQVPRVFGILEEHDFGTDIWQYLYDGLELVGDFQLPEPPLPA